MQKQVSAWQKYWMWAKERFPVFGVLLYAGSLFYLSYLFGHMLEANASVQWLHSLPGLALVFLVLLHLRIFDEHKDYQDDLIAHPERALSKGIITLKDLRLLLYGVLFLEALISFFSGGAQFVIWLIILGWSLLMLVEFFARDFLKARIGLYLFTHQLLVPLLLLYGLFLQLDSFDLSTLQVSIVVLFLAGGMCGTIVYEIARKTWSPDREHEHAESYTRLWGMGKAVFINLLIALAALLIFCFLFFWYKVSLAYFLLLLFFYLVFVFCELLFYFKPVRKMSKLVEAGGTLFMLGLFITSAVAFFNIY
ncbi:MAG: hypothetical protein ACOCZ2_03275 [Thermodesulfobacteriota bacterium]